MTRDPMDGYRHLRRRETRRVSRRQTLHESSIEAASLSLQAGLIRGVNKSSSTSAERPTIDNAPDLTDPRMIRGAGSFVTSVNRIVHVRSSTKWRLSGLTTTMIDFTLT